VTELSQAEQGIIFINYRRTDAGWPADHLATELKRAFGDDRVFLDVRNIDAGGNFTDEIEEQVRQATVLLVLIGKDWLLAHDKYGRRRLDKEDDWVRKEIRIGLQGNRAKSFLYLLMTPNCQTIRMPSLTTSQGSCVGSVSRYDRRTASVTLKR